MGRTIDPNDHKNNNRRYNRSAAPRPGWINPNMGEPCGYCCLTMWWNDITDYSKKPCPITFPNNKEYVKFCIDYTQSILHTINVISNYRDLSGWPGFKAIRSAAQKFSAEQGTITYPDPWTGVQTDRAGGQGVAFPPNYFPLEKLKKDSVTSGEEFCKNYYEIIKFLETRGNNSFGIVNYNWNNSGHCGSLECDCNYPCPDAAITKKVWTGGSTCDCASPLIFVDEKCLCQGDDYNNPKKQFLITKARDRKYAPAYPLGRCGCKEKTDSGKPTFLYAKPKEGSECPDCECKQAEVLGKDGKWYPIDTVFESSLEDKPGRCECDDSKDLEEWTELSKYGILRCRCKDPYVWDPELEQCILRSNYIDWGKVEITDVEFSESGGFEKQCPESYEWVSYTIKFTVDDLRNADWANIYISFEPSNNLKLQEWYVESETGPNDIILERGNINSINFSKAAPLPEPLPSIITIGKHYPKNNFSPGPYKNYYDKYLNLKHFQSFTSNKYIVIVKLNYEIQSIDDGDTFGITAKFNNLQAETFTGRENFNIGAGSSSASHTHTYDINCEEPTLTESVTPPPSETPSP